MKLKSRRTKIFVYIFSILIVLIGVYFVRRQLLILFADKTWIADLGYKENEIHKLSFDSIGHRSCPEIPVQVDNNTFHLTFDTGCGTGLQFTDVVEDKMNYTLSGTIEALNRDGSHRGWTKKIQIDGIKVFDEQFSNITTSIADWSMFSSAKFDGLIGLAYFQSKVITLDYAGHRIGITTNPIDYTKLDKDTYIVLPLYKTTSKGQEDLLFFEAEYNHQPVMVYMDTGSNYSYLYNPQSSTTSSDKPNCLLDIPLKIGGLELTLKGITEVNDIAQADDLPYTTMITLNSDQIWKCKLLVTIDLIEQKIIIKK